ncbi:hypothetical protein PSAB6_430090 [Paraburkholderia sabiae]|nr:hypothetical protein PSAB6_430090 [Paraburkholderia sabiae]
MCRVAIAVVERVITGVMQLHEFFADLSTRHWLVTLSKCGERSPKQRSNDDESTKGFHGNYLRICPLGCARTCVLQPLNKV